MFKYLYKCIDYFIPDQLKKEGYLYLNAFAFVSIHFFLLFICFAIQIQLFLDDITPKEPLLEGMILGLISIVIFKKYSNMVLSGNLLTIIYTALITYGIYETDYLYSDNIMWLIVTPLIAFLFTNVQSGIFWSSYIMLVVLHNYWIVQFTDTSQLPLYPYEPNYYLYSYLFLFSTVIGMILIFVQNKQLIIAMLQQQKLELFEQQKILEEQRIELQLQEKIAMDRQIAELKLQALQAQMNPHFIFNALHSIQSFIIHADEKSANHYIVKFSRLMRLFLESSKEKFIVLKDEILLIQLYIELEHLRFKDKFTFFIHLDQQLDQYNIEIPSMVIQPFVENAINHGLLHKKNKGILQIHFMLEDNNILCTIEDNGIGREAALALKKASYKSYKSRGMNIVNDRLQLINTLEKQHYDITISDLEDANGSATGTKVYIKFPFIAMPQ